MDRDTQDGLAIPPDLLEMTPEQLRTLGYWVVDRTIEHLKTLDARPAITPGSATELLAALGGTPPIAAGDVVADLNLLADVALEHQQHGDHPRYFARVPGPSSPAAILGDWLATGMQSVASSWGGGSGPTTIELVTLSWLRDALGLAPTSEGVMLSGGSMANATAFMAARSRQGDGVIYMTDQTHASIKRALLAFGQPESEVRMVATDAQFRMDPQALREEIARDLAAGRTPAIVVGTSGTTNTGAVDDLEELRAICDDHGMWLHVDGAYGGPVALGHRGRTLVTDLNLADSFVMDPHKWLFQPYDLACCYVAHEGLLHETFAMYPEYLADVSGEEVDMSNRSLELSRRSRAIKLWLTLRTYGLDTLGSAIDRGIALAEYAQALVDQSPVFETFTPAQLGIVTFTAPQADDAAHRRAATALTADGYAAVTSTTLRGRTVLRLCTINPKTTTEDLDGTISRLARFVVESS